MKIAHEAPLSIFNHVQTKTDYDYALVHLFDESVEYLTKFELALARGREVILDNSIFELGKAFDAARFAHWVQYLQPTYYIVPDVLEDGLATIKQFDSFMSKWSSLPGKVIGVAQGSTFEEFVECYNYLVDKVDKIAISFDYSFFKNPFWFPDEPTKYHSYMKGRRALIETMKMQDILREDVPHHLLGCGLPQEFIAYKNDKWIDSVDTSNPVVHGIKNIRYQDKGLEDKESVKLFTMIDEDVLANIRDIDYNIAKFREFCNG